MTQKMLSKSLFMVFLVIFFIAGCSEKSNLKPVEEAAAKSPSQIEIDDTDLLKKLQFQMVKSKSRDAVSMAVLEKVADRHASAIWGPEIARGQPLQLVDADDEPVLYAFPFAIGSGKFPESVELLKQFNKLQRTEGIFDKTKETIPTTIPSIVGEEAARYGMIYVSARKRDFPVRRVSHALHPYFYNARRALLHVGADTAELVKLRYVPPHEFFEIQFQDSVLRLHTHMLISEEEIRASAKKFKGTPVSKGVTAEPTSSYAKQAAEAWKAYEQPVPAPMLKSKTPLSPSPSPRAIEFRIRYWERMPAIDWTRWCEPTAASIGFLLSGITMSRCLESARMWVMIGLSITG